MSYSINTPTSNKPNPSEVLELLQRLAIKGLVISKDSYDKVTLSEQQAQRLAEKILKPQQQKLLKRYKASLPKLIESVAQNEILLYDPGDKKDSIAINGVLVPNAWIRFRFGSENAAGSAGSTMWSIAQDMCASEKDVWAYFLPVVREYTRHCTEMYGTMEWQNLHRMRLYDGFGSSWRL